MIHLLYPESRVSSSWFSLLKWATSSKVVQQIVNEGKLMIKGIALKVVSMNKYVFVPWLVYHQLQESFCYSESQHSNMNKKHSSAMKKHQMLKVCNKTVMLFKSCIKSKKNKLFSKL